MRAYLRMVVLVLLPSLCASCDPPKDDTDTPAAAKAVTAPMAARERLLHDVEIQKQKANVRAGQMQAVIDSNQQNR